MKCTISAIPYYTFCYYRYVRVEVPIHIIRTPSISKACLESLVELPHIISQEEEESYQAVSKEAGMNLATQIHNGAGKMYNKWTFSHYLVI